MKKLLTTLALVAIPMVSFAGEKPQKESYYVDAHCAEIGGRTEFRTEYNTRIDCITPTHAYEYDFARKWAEAIGQSLHYGMATNSQAGIVVIVDDRSSKDDKYLLRLYDTIKNVDLDIEVIEIYTNNYEYRNK